MESIENYKKRFFNLMESTIGDVRPLISEQLSPDKIREYKAKWSMVDRMGNRMDDQEKDKHKKMYQTAIDGKKLINGEENSYIVTYFNDKNNEKYISQLVTMYDTSHNTKSSELGKSPITKPQELTGDELTKFYNVMIGAYMNQRDDFKNRVIRNDFDARTIFATLLKNRDNKIPVKTVQEYINSETGKNYDLIDIYNQITDKEKLAAIGQKQTSK